MFAEVVAPAFFRCEPRWRAQSYLLGLASGLERKNGWTLAEFAGESTPDGMQRLLNAARWDAGVVRGALSRYVAGRLGDPGGVLIADETGFEKTGVHSAGVQRQYTGTAGKITNCQVGVFLSYAVPAKGTRVLVDRELYIPRSWTGDRDRCAAAGIPGDVAFATKPQLAQKMIERAMKAGLPFSWFSADEAYGDNGLLRDWLEEARVAYVVAVSCDHLVPAGAGKAIRADTLAAKVPARGWHTMSCGPGSKGERWYDWALAVAGPGRHLLIRRSLTRGELQPRTRPRWTTTRSASTTPGTGTSPWPCAPWRGSPSPPPRAARRPAEPKAAGRPATVTPPERGRPPVDNFPGRRRATVTGR